MYKTLICILLSAFSGTLKTTAGEVQTLLSELDHVIAENHLYVSQHEARIANIAKRFKQAKTDKERYHWERELYFSYQSYQSFNIDSALLHAQRKLQIALRLNNVNEQNYSMLDVANLLIRGGDYKEAENILGRMSPNSMEVKVKIYYFSVSEALYSSLQRVSLQPDRCKFYQKEASRCRDSILSYDQSPSIWVISDRLIEKKKYPEAITVLSRFYKTLDPYDRQMAYAAYAISNVYRQKGDREKEKEYLIRSAIADLKNAVREYISLGRLAKLLYEDGDIRRSYNYMRHALDDATTCNARQRTIEVSDVMPIIERAYEGKLNKERQRIILALSCITILAAFLVAALFFIRKQMRKLARAKASLHATNIELTSMNQEADRLNRELRITCDKLHDMNDQLVSVNGELIKTNEIKDMYLTKFMTYCSSYIDKMDDYRKSLKRLLADGKTDELFENLKSPALIDQEIDEFFGTFDATFLHLFPSFIESLNLLLLPENQIQLRKGYRFNTELRICALIRLGIHDNDRLASFLRCSKATVYSYRSRIRLKSANPDCFEQDIMKILA